MAAQPAGAVAIRAAHPAMMRAIVLTAPRHLSYVHVPVPLIGADDVLVRVSACGVCDLDASLVDGMLPGARYPIVPGHEVVGHVVEAGHHVRGLSPGDRVGIPRLGWACGRCRSCTRGLEHLCPNARLTGATQDGGMAEYVRADHRFSVRLHGGTPDAELAPLLCAGAAVRRALAALGRAQRIGLFGPPAETGPAAALARLRGREVVVAHGGATARPRPLDAALVFAPAAELVRDALEAVVDGGLVVWVCPLPGDRGSTALAQLGGERQVRSVAGATRRDLHDLVAEVATRLVELPVRTLPMEAAADAIASVRTGRPPGRVVLLAG